MSNTLISDDVLYIKDISVDGGTYVDGIWVPSDSDTYITFEGTWEPYQDGEGMIALPEGVSSGEAILLYTNTELNTVDSEGDDAIEADIICLKNPTTFPTTKQYKIHSKGDWEMNSSFQLFSSYGEYLAVRLRAP